MIGIKITGVLILVGIFFRVGMPGLKHSLKEMLLFTIIVTAAGVLSILKLLELGVPTPLYFVSWVFKPISELILLLQ